MNEEKKLLIIGAGGHGRVVADVARLCGYIEVSFLDDSYGTDAAACNVVDKVCAANKYYCTHDFFVAIGKSEIRERIMNEIKSDGGILATLVHPSAVIGSNVEIGCGSVVMAGVVINAGAVIGDGVIINTSSSVDHDCRIGNYVHVSVGAHLAGTVKVGKRTMIGAGATVINNIDICEDCMVGAGAVVVRNIKNSGTYIGVPSRLKK